MAVTEPDYQPAEGVNLLEPVWRNGELLRDESFATIRARAAEAK